jgi:hypothetical protein
MLASKPKFPQAVEVDGVTVVAKKTGTGTRSELWVQDPGGTDLASGVHIFCDTSAGTNPCAKDQYTILDGLNVGDVIDIKGVFDNNNFNNHPTDYEIKAPTVTKTGRTATPKYITVDAAKVAVDQFSSAEYANYSNVLVHIEGPITVTGLSAKQYGTTSCAPKPTADAGPKADAGVDVPDAPPATTAYIFGFEAMKGSTTLNIGIRFPTFSGCLPDCDICAPNNQCSACLAEHHIQMGDVYKSVQGLAYGNLQQSTMFLEIQPVTDADLAK